MLNTKEFSNHLKCVIEARSKKVQDVSKETGVPEKVLRMVLKGHKPHVDYFLSLLDWLGMMDEVSLFYTTNPADLDDF